MTLQVLPEGLTATSAAVAGLTARLAAIHAELAPTICAIVPPAIDFVSTSTAAEFDGTGAAHQAQAADALGKLGQAAEGVAETGIDYQTTDTAIALSYLRETI